MTASLRVGPLVLRTEAGGLAVEDQAGSTLLPLHAVRTLVERYGHALDGGVAPSEGSLALEGACHLATLSYRSPVDVIANDYVVLHRGSERPPLAVPTPRFVAALRALVRAATGTA